MKKFIPFFLILTLLPVSACYLSLDEGFPSWYPLSEFFDALNSGRYDDAAELFGGSYETLIAMNPEIDPNDHAALWKNACEINGFQCLSTREITSLRETASGEMLFLVSFSTDDGDLFVQLLEDGTLVSEFEYHLARGSGNDWGVIDLPVYVP